MFMKGKIHKKNSQRQIEEGREGKKKKEKEGRRGRKKRNLFLCIFFLVGSLELGSAREPLCAKANRMKSSLEAKKISA